MEHPTHSDYAGSDPGVDVLVKCVCMSKHHKHVRHFRGIPRINIFAEILFSWKNISHVGDFPDAPSIHGMTVFLANGARAVVGTILINIEIDGVSELYVVVEARLLRTKQTKGVKTSIVTPLVVRAADINSHLVASIVGENNGCHVKGKERAVTITENILSNSHFCSHEHAIRFTMNSCWDLDHSISMLLHSIIIACFNVKFQLIELSIIAGIQKELHVPGSLFLDVPVDEKTVPCKWSIEQGNRWRESRSVVDCREIGRHF